MGCNWKLWNVDLCGGEHSSVACSGRAACDDLHGAGAGGVKRGSGARAPEGREKCAKRDLLFHNEGACRVPVGTQRQRSVKTDK